MQTLTVTRDFLFSNACTFEMLIELAMHKDFCGMSKAAVEKLAKQPLKGASKGNGSPKQNGVGDLPNAKLRTIVVQKLQDSPEQGDVFKAGNMQFEFTCLPDLDINKAGANKKASGPRNAVTQLKGYYVVVKRGLKCTEESDPEKFAIWKHIWACNSFEEYFKAAPAKAVTRTGRIITAASEMGWAIKSKWVRACTPEEVAKMQEEAAKQDAEKQ